jgi:nicotinic acid mononucleotide adenylyltransferase
MKNYRQLVKELPSKKVVFAFGRFQPPTTGHELLVNAVKKLAGTTADHVIYASKTEDKKSNPLPVARKVYFLKRMFPKTNFLAASAEVRTPIEAAKELNKKYKNIVLVAGSDRVASFQKLLNDYNGKEYHFDTIEVVSAGERDPDSDTASGMSGTKMREAAVAGDFNKFKKGLPHTLTELDGRRLMNDIRKGLGHPVIKESFVVTTNVLRERYINEEIFLIGDKVQDTNGVYEIMDRGTNYVTVADSQGNLSKKWLDQITESEITEDIQGGYAPKEVSFKGYTTKNLHHSADATDAFMQTIQRQGDKDPVAVLNALKATDTYMKINDLHLEQGGIAPDQTEIDTWIAAHDKAKESLDRVGEFLHHEDYWHMHQHELEGLLTNYKETGKDDMNEELSDKTIKGSDKIKVARIIANTFGVENAEATSDPTQLVNSGLRKVRGKAFNADSLKIIGKMLELAREVGIQYDNNLVPTKLKEGTIQPNGTDKIDVQTSAPTDRTKTVYYKDFKKMIQKEEVVDKKDNESDHDYEARMSAHPHSHVGHAMSAPSDSTNLRRQKVRYRLGEATDAEKAAKESAKASLAAKQAKEKEALTNKQAKEKEAISEDDDIVTRSDYKVSPSGRKVHKQLRFKSFTNDVKEEVELDESAADLNKHISTFSSGVKSSAAKQSTYKRDGKPIHNMKHVETDSDHQKVFDHLKKMGYKKTSGHDPKPNEFDMHHNRDEMTSKSDPVHHSSGISAHVEKEHGGKTKVHFTHRSMKEEVQLDESYEKAEAHRTKAVEAQKKGDAEKFHHHMSNHYEALSQWHDSKGRHNMADLTSQKADKHHEASLNGGKLKTEEVTEEPAMKHRVAVTVSDPNHTAVSKRKEQVQKFAKVTAASEADALKKASAHFKKAGFKIHGAEHHSMVKEDLNELSNDTLGSYKKKAGAEASAADKAGDTKKADKRFSGIIKATKKEFVNDLRKEATKAEMEGDKDYEKYKDPFFEENEEEMSDDDMDAMINNTQDHEFLDAYDEDELHIVDLDTGEPVEDDGEDIKEETLMEVLSRFERMRAKMRFAKTKSKRERRMAIALKARSNSQTINKRARRMAVILMKKRIARKPLSQLSIGEKERLEQIIQKRKAVIGRIAMKLTPRMRKIEQNRLSHTKGGTGSTNNAF